jgi:predicted Zn-dependent protease with MMP-like domain
MIKDVKTWSGTTPPSNEDFLSLADAAWQGLPEAFKQMCGTVVIQVTDFAPTRCSSTLRWTARMSSPGFIKVLI